MACGCCCDPHKLAYLSGIFTAVEAVLFGAINVVLVCMSQCYIKPKSLPGAGLDKFWAWYFLDPDQALCNDILGINGAANVPEYPLNSTLRAPQTEWDENEKYQIAYLCLHAVWFISSLIMIYGNARKLWGYYVPWLLVTLTLLIMDATLGSFIIIDMTTMSGNGTNWDEIKAFGPMMWALSLYFRGYVFWIANLVEFGNVMNAFCKTYHKRSKQARKDKANQKELNDQQTHYEAKLAAATAAAAAAAAAQPTGPPTGPAGGGMERQHAPDPQSQYRVPQPPQVLPPQPPSRYQGQPASPFQGQPSPFRGQPPSPYQGQPPYQDMLPMQHQVPPQEYGGPPHLHGYDNHSFDSDHPPIEYKRAPPVPQKPHRVPTELLPFSYVNPGFRPAHPHDVAAMKAAGRSQNDGYSSEEGRGPTNVRRQESSRGFSPLAQPQYPLPSPMNDPRPTGDYDEPWDIQDRPSNLQQLKPLPRVNLKIGPPTSPTSRGPSPSYGQPSYRGNNY